VRLHKDVKQLLKTHGYAVAFSRVQSGGAFDPATGTVTGGSTLTWSGRGVFINYMDEDVAGTSITTDDRKLLLQADGLPRAPEVSDMVTGVGQVMDVRTIQSGAIVVAYICQVRG
jgi:hypothetical protein